MSGPENWQPGDLALCIKANPCGHDATKAGSVYTVLRFWMNPRYGDPSLHLAEAPHRSLPIGGSLASRFRKVTPPKADEFDREVIELMAGKPVREDG